MSQSLVTGAEAAVPSETRISGPHGRTTHVSEQTILNADRESNHDTITYTRSNLYYVVVVKETHVGSCHLM